MSQFATFFVPIHDDGLFMSELNAFLRGRHVLQVERQFTGEGWAFFAFLAAETMI